MTSDAQAEALLRSGLRQLQLPRADKIGPKMIAFGRLLMSENKRTNLTGARDLSTLVTAHFLDSLAPLRLIQLREPIVDVGSGAGFPGIPAAIAYPSRNFILLEPRAKRAAFLESAITCLGLSNVSVIKSSALGPRAASLTGKAGLVLMRGVVEPTQAFGLCLPLLKPGGTLLLYEGRLSHPTIDHRKAAKRLGSGPIRVKQIKVPYLRAERYAWFTTKIKM